MKALYFIVILLTIGISTQTTAQITNLLVNNSSTNFSMTSGDTVRWEYNISPVGATVNGELWYDVNQNGVIDTATDKARFIFTQTDGDPSGNGGPPDMDGTADGHVLFMQRLGLSPGKYIFKLSYNSDVHIVTGTTLALVSPAHTISGTVTAPPGKSSQYIFVQVQRNEQYQPNFWEAVTDFDGNYTIGITADTAGNPWSIRLADHYNPFPPSVVTPSEIPITISAPSYTGNDFAFVQSAAKVVGYLKDENNNPLPSQGVNLYRNDGGVNQQSNTDGAGYFQIGLQLTDLINQTWSLQSQCNCNNGETGSQLIAHVDLPVINSGDSLYRVLIVYNANAQIQGHVRVDGLPPGFPIHIQAEVTDTTQAQTNSDSTSGNFTLNVSNKFTSYNVFVYNLPFGYYSNSVFAHPGDTGIVVNIFTQTNALVSWNDGWNILSLPLNVNNNQKTVLFPNAISPAYSYTTASGYQTQSNLFNGIGYWMKFNGSNSTSLNGTYVAQETLGVATGWNLIGIPSGSIPIANIISIPASIIVSPFYGYSSGSGYQSVTTLDPGKGYWVKVNQNGSLVLNTTAGAQASSVDKWSLTNELPPPPPSNIDGLLPQHMPTTYALGQNYPNPFNPTTTINYDIPVTSFVRLSIFNTLGQEVIRLVNQEQAAGTYSAHVDVSHLPSGIYFYRLLAGKYSATNKMMFMK